MAEEKLIGKISHYYEDINVGIIELEDSLSVDDIIYIKGQSTNFGQKVDSMQVDHNPVDTAGAGTGVGIRVAKRVMEGDEVYRVM